MNIMKKHLLPMLLLGLLSSTAAFAKTHVIKVEFNLIPYDSINLEEPSGKFKVKVELEAKGDGVDNPFLEQTLRDTVTPIVKKYKELLEPQMQLIDKLIKEDALTEEEALEQVEKLNTLYNQMRNEAKSEADKAVKQEWQALVNKDKQLRDWKIDTTADIAQGVYTLSKGVAEAIGTSGVALAKNIVSIISSAVDIGTNLYKLAQSEDTARKNLQEAMKNVDDKLKGEKRGIIPNLKDFFSGSENILEQKLELYENKWIEIRQQAEKLSKKIDKVLKMHEELKKTQPAPDGLAELEEMTAKYLEAIDKINDSRQSGETMMKVGKELLAAARAEEGAASALRDALKKVYGAYETISTYMDPLDGLVDAGTRAGKVAAKKLGDALASKQ